MAPAHSRLIAVALFAVGVFAAQNVPSLIAYIFGTGRTMTGPEWEFRLEVTVLASMAAAVGFALARCRSLLRALCAVPIAVLLPSLVPGRLGFWLSESFHSVAINVAVAGLLFVIAGAAAGWLAVRFFNQEARHA